MRGGTGSSARSPFRMMRTTPEPARIPTEKGVVMADLVVSLIPLVIGVVMSPLAIMALVAVLLSSRARSNGIAFLIGWALALVFVVGASFVILGLLEVDSRHSLPTWADILRLVLGVVLLLGAVVVYRRGGKAKKAMAKAATPGEVVAAAPQLPGWLHAVASFSPARSLALGFGIFALNPVDASCAVLAALSIRLAEVTSATAFVVAIVFIVVGAAPIGLPVVLILVRGSSAEPFLNATRTWIATHTNVTNAALLLVIAILQIQKGLSGLLG
jgi:ABC-type transport system involved in multi-copper enzyme maturation permease subunit